MGLPNVHFQMVTVIGEEIKIIKEKDMDNISGLMERVTKGNTSRVTNVDMEYTDGQAEHYIMGNSNRIIYMVMAIIGGQMEMNITESTRMA